MAEAYTNHAAQGVWSAVSAGSNPTGKVNPFAIETLRAHGVDPGAPRSKSWDEFAGDGAPMMDLVVTVCSSAAGETCPIWPGGPVRLHWDLPDPAAVTGGDAEKRAAFEEVFAMVRTRVDALLAEGR